MRDSFLFFVLAMTPVVTACFDTATIACPTGIRCPASQRCAANQAACITSPCGNGLVDIDEVCDDGNIVSGDGCRNDCKSNEVCGNAVVDSHLGEECDEAGLDTATCDANCTMAGCGDGTVNPVAGEVCDDAGESAFCNVDCTYAVCGDDKINISADEECDEAGLDTPTCNADCTATGCGDGTVNRVAGEVCDDAGESRCCDRDCTFAECGDLQTNTSAGEDCDEGLGNTFNCDADCTFPLCGDGTVNRVAGEVCDDAGESAFCDMDCTFSECGDSMVNITAGEDCDEGPGNTPNCDADCTYAECGDGYVNGVAGEACDDGDTTYGGNGCTEDCKFTVDMTCEAGNDPGQMGHLGFPAIETPGFTVTEGSFHVFMNEDDDDPLAVTVPLPSGTVFFALPLISGYITNGDEINRWSITTEIVGNDAQFTIDLKDGNPGTQLMGKLLVFGFDNITSGYVAGDVVGYSNGDTVTIGPRPLARRNKVLPIAYVTGYNPISDHDMGWTMHWTVEPSCSGTFSVQETDSSDEGKITWHAAALMLSEYVRVTEIEFDQATDTVPKSHPYSRANPKSSLIWMPFINVNDTGTADDFAFAADCRSVADGLSCSVAAWGALGKAASIKGRFIILESLTPFQ